MDLMFYICFALPDVVFVACVLTVASSESASVKCTLEANRWRPQNLFQCCIEIKNVGITWTFSLQEPSGISVGKPGDVAERRPYLVCLAQMPHWLKFYMQNSNSTFCSWFESTGGLTSGLITFCLCHFNISFFGKLQNAKEGKPYSIS